MNLTGFDYVLWVATFVGACALLFTMITRHRVARFPCFTALIGLGVIRTIALYCVRRFGSKGDYFYTYWSLGALDAGLQISVAFEIAARVFWRKKATLALQYAAALAVLLVLIAAGITLLATPRTTDWILGFVIRGDFFSSVLLSEILAALIVWSVRQGFAWRMHVGRIASGLGVFATTSVLIDASSYYFGTVATKNTFNDLAHGRICLYVVCLGYWIVSLWNDEPKPQTLPADLHVQLLALRQRAAALLRRLEQA